MDNQSLRILIDNNDKEVLKRLKEENQIEKNRIEEEHKQCDEIFERLRKSQYFINSIVNNRKCYLNPKLSDLHDVKEMKDDIDELARIQGNNYWYIEEIIENMNDEHLQFTWFNEDDTYGIKIKEEVDDY
jgi:hypothetical protein